LVNRSEWRSIETGLPPGSLRDTEIIQTLGADGSTARRGDAEPVHAPGERVDLLDPTGAGDAFAAAYLLATLAGLPLDRRLAVGNISGALAVTAIGARGRLCTLQDLANWP
jgi:ribokinase